MRGGIRHALGRLAPLLMIGLMALAESCGESRDAHVIPPDRLVNLLIDVYRINGLINSVDSLRAQYDSGFLDIYSDILMRHGYTGARLDSTLRDMCDNPNRYTGILERVVEGLRTLEDSAMRHLSKQDSTERGSLSELEEPL